MNNSTFLIAFLVICTAGVHATWPLDWGLGGWGFGAWTSHQSPARELQDELHDGEILKAVVTSMADWERARRDTTRARRADSSVCYAGVGCFMGSAPFSYLGVLPASPAEVGTSFHFFSPREPHRARSLAFEEIVVPAAAVVSPISAALTAATGPAAPQEQIRGRRDNSPTNNTPIPAVATSSADEVNTTITGVNESTTSTATPAIAGSLAGNDAIAGVLDMAINLGFNSSLNTKMIVHGFGSSCSHVWVHEMRSALMAVEDCNIICVDWEPGASIPNYVRAAANTRLVGKQVALLLRRLRAQLGLDPRRVHLIGFSLGAHVAGFAGAETPGLSRITGLDPAGPLFESQETEARLDAGDAQFVDVIHSNGANLILGGLGSYQPMGHVDFYPNGGREQKGCSNLLLGAVSDISLLWSSSEGDSRSLCNHRRAYKFFTDSVSPRCPFPAFPCENYEEFLDGECFSCGPQRQCGNMGYYADRSPARGPLFLITRDNEPFCAHQFYLRVDSTASNEPMVTNGRLQVLLTSKELNETFTLTQKDDELMETGESLSRLVVAHPVMVHPTSAQIIYTAYSGWLSSGTSTWAVDKILVTDAFGKSVSFCKRGMVLSSGVPLLVPLFPGDCNPPRPGGLDFASVSTSLSNELSNGPGENFSTSPSPTQTGQDETNQTSGENSSENKSGIELVITLNKNENKNEQDGMLNDQPSTNQSTSTDYPLYHRPWLNEQSNNSLSDSRIENSRSLASNDNRRALTNVSDQQSKSSWWNSSENESENGTYTIQLLPRRLSSMLQQAEQYARATISSVASTIIGGTKEETDPPKRRAKFFPPFSSLFGYGDVKPEVITEKPSISRQDTGFSPMQVIKSQEWRISRYIPLRRYAARVETNNNQPQEQQQKDEQFINNKSDALITDSKPTIMGPR